MPRSARSPRRGTRGFRADECRRQRSRAVLGGARRDHGRDAGEPSPGLSHLAHIQAALALAESESACRKVAGCRIATSTTTRRRAGASISCLALSTCRKSPTSRFRQALRNPLPSCCHGQLRRTSGPRNFPKSSSMAAFTVPGYRTLTEKSSKPARISYLPGGSETLSFASSSLRSLTVPGKLGNCSTAVDERLDDSSARDQPGTLSHLLLFGELPDDVHTEQVLEPESLGFPRDRREEHVLGEIGRAPFRWCEARDSVENDRPFPDSRKRFRSKSFASHAKTSGVMPAL